MKYSISTLWFLASALSVLSFACSPEPSADLTAHRLDGAGEVEEDESSPAHVIVTGQVMDASYKVAAYQGGELARARIWNDELEVHVHVLSRERAELYVDGVVIDGFGELDDDERAALDALAESSLATSLAMVPLDHECDAAGAVEPIELQALLFPWQVLLKYTSADPAATAREAATSSTCAYFPPLVGEQQDPRPHASQLLLSRSSQFPRVLGFFPLDEEGELAPPRPPIGAIAGNLTTCGFGPGNSGCRGACGADCTSNNCVMQRYNVTKCGKTVPVTRYTCGVHQGCIEHDACFDLCNRRHGAGSLAASGCMRVCDGLAMYDYSVCDAYNWSRGYGQKTHEIDFYYHDNCGEAGFECFEEELELESRRNIRTTGDPHLVTLDRVAYDFQAAGEFVLIEATEGAPFEVQVRQESGGSRQCPSSVAFNTAVATMIGSSRVAIYAGQDPALFIDGTPARLPGGSLPLGDDAAVVQSGNKYTLFWSSGERLEVQSHGTLLDIFVSVPEERRGQLRGLLGTYDGDQTNELQLRDGEVLPSPIDWDDLYGKFADSWRVDDARSLFDYEGGLGTSFYQRPGVPTRVAGDLIPDEVRASAEMVCRAAGVEDPTLLESCIVDIGCTGDESFAQRFAAQTPPEVALDVSKPVFMDGWMQTGDPDYGDWIVDPDGRSVVQTVNNEPTFFVSERSYLGETIRGTIQVATTADDDYVGFVFGYDTPLVDGDPFSFWLFDWKKGYQDTAEEGGALWRIDSSATDLESIFWYRTDPGVRLVASDFEPESGWLDYVEYQFEMAYLPERVLISINGREIIDVTAAEAGVPAFEPGLFGFYNYSQPNVRYGNFETIAGVYEPVFADDFDREPLADTHADFTKWSALGAVDVIEPLEYGPGFAVRLDGTDQGSGSLTSKDTIELTPGTYRLLFDVRSREAGAESIRVRLGDVFDETIDVSTGEGGAAWRTLEYSINVEQAASATLEVSTSSDDGAGALLDRIALSRRL